MGFSFLLFIGTLLLSCILVHCGPLSYQSLTPNFTATNFKFIDTNGAFLSSPNGTFEAAITNKKSQERSYYFVVIHSESHVVVWTANRNLPVSDSGELRLSVDGLTLFDDSGDSIWSTKTFHSRSSTSSLISSMQLLESGNLVLVDALNNSVWESFDFPTDTIVVGQRLPVRRSLVSREKEDELAEGDYELVVTENDVLLQWNEMTYWKLSMETKSFRDTNAAVEYMMVKSDGLFLFGANGTKTAIQVVLEEVKSRDFRIGKLEGNGHFDVKRFSNGNWMSEFDVPSDSCRVAFTCKKLGVCDEGSCSCPPGFRISSEVNGSCAPIDRDLVMAVSCNASLNVNATDLGNRVSYLRLENGMDYFANDFTEPVMHGVNLTVCQDLCSKNCSCLSIFHDQSSGSCYMIENFLGSMFRGSDSGSGRGRLGYVKVTSDPSSLDRNDKSDNSFRFPLVGLVLLPSSGVLLIILTIAGILWLMRRKRSMQIAGKRLGRADSSSSDEFDSISILGLPVKFDHEEIRVATECFSTPIGTGGFGTVYKGTLSDGTVVAVKKMNSLGAHGKKEFCTEIAIIGRVHHVNLVSLKGFCAHRGERFLVYEYMNRGSLDRTLFGNGPALEWRTRFDIALGTARGLTYLHGGCEQKIIHCDVKPENILLHDNLQVKISDFGLSKLLNSEQSSWFTTMRGTRGYLAPEWLTSSAITEKSDVYSYGMVLLEIVRGKKNSSFQPPNITTSESDSSESNRLFPISANQSIYFPLFALEMHEQKKYLELVDPRVLGHVKSEEVEKLVRVALCCLHEDPTLRPTMANVVGMLEGVLPLAMPQVQSLNFLRFYGRRFTEASMIEGVQEVNVFELHQQNRNFSSTTSSSYNSFSYMSSQQLSGPR
ncbi:G-type lectin S-receptor-like serine/threonine-protein kinase At5g35370 [Capsicum annuum]|uniref:G-type lectin S-receptor-like serine/threonine-protein kinase At5g35370 n=1 Tax=Capsicum annuum TaxID=4072 RepID=UPI001FB0BCCE|nr:G-type lectin S-receptor-like serine/threonine-protein kinase At5g35370 [Capsicum annuum]